MKPEVPGMLGRYILPLIVCLGCFAVLGLLVWGIDRSQTIKWVGGADLSVEFVVTDADSGQPIPNARVNIFCEGGFYDGAEEDFKVAFDIRTDDAGIAR